jgi:fucose permease
MGWGWRTACLVLLPLPLVLFAAFARMTFPSIVSDEKERTLLGAILKEKWFLGAMAAIFLGGATELGMAQWLPAYAESALGFPQWISGVGLLLFSIAMAAGRMIVGAFGTKLNPFQTMAWGCSSSVVLFIPGGIVSAHLLARPRSVCTCRIYRKLSVAHNAGSHRRSLSQWRSEHVRGPGSAR